MTVVTCVVIVALILAAYAASPDDITALGDGWVRLLASLAIVAGAITVAVRSVMRSPYPILRAVETIIAVVCLAVVVFASMYLAISVADANAFTEPLDHTSAIYFATTTATTVGFGDISPASDPARIVVMCQMATNVIVIGVVARLLIGTARRRSGI